MKIKEAIILAGGLGTRLQNTIPGLPKCMAPVAGHPFIFYIINYLRLQGIERFVFSLGYRHEIIIEYLENNFATLDYVCSIETEALGTGGAILLACKLTTEETILVVNGDTLYKTDLEELGKFHEEKNAGCTLALKTMQDFDRYGVVELGKDQSLQKFREKQFYKKGLINGGTYILDKNKFLSGNHLQKFSFEKEYLETQTAGLFGCIQEGYFIDIGVPEDLLLASNYLKRKPLDLASIDNSWTLLIDRDGVINQEKKDGYILNWEEFHFYEGVKASLKILALKFGKIIIVSNQRGVGKGLMSETDLMAIHNRMKAEIENEGGRIDAIYYCTGTENKAPCRKPNPGMIYRAKKDFPSIDLSRALVIGNKPSDMLFGRNAGIYTVYVNTTHPLPSATHPDIDLVFDSLPGFTKAL